MKKSLLLSILSILVLSSCGIKQAQSLNSLSNDDQTSHSDNTSFDSGSSGNSDSSEEPDDPEEPETHDISNLGLEQYVANIQNANSLRIRKNNTKRTMRADEDDNSQTLVKTVTTYDDGGFVSGEEELEVYFTKIDTTTTTSIVNGEESYYSFEDGVGDDENPIYSISFVAYEGFVYSIFDTAGQLLFDEVLDNDTQDADEENGTIKISGLEKDEVYVVKYTGYGEEVVVTQELVGAEIDKIYVYSARFSFMSFVPYGTSQRPYDADLTIDTDGVSTYDKQNYYSGSDRQSFLLDNCTGLVYKIEGIHIHKFEKRVLYLDNQLPCGFKINENNELEVFRIVKNETVRFTNIFGDKFNQYYVQNSDLVGTDVENNTTYFTSTNEYIYTHNGYVLKVECEQAYGFNLRLFVSFSKFSKMGSDFQLLDINEDESFNIQSNFAYGLFLTNIRGGYLYTYKSGKEFSRYPLHPAPYDEEQAMQGPYNPESYGQNMSFDFNMWQDYTSTTWTISDNLALFYSNFVFEYSGENSSSLIKQDYCLLSFFYIWEVEYPESGAVSSCYVFDENNKVTGNLSAAQTILLENCLFDGYRYDNGENYPVFKQVTFSETIYYRVVYDNGYPEVVNSDTYVAPDNQVVVIQPITRS